MARRSRGGYLPAVVGAVTVISPAVVGAVTVISPAVVGAVTVIWPIVVVFLRCPAPCHVIAGKRRKRSNASCHQHRDGTDQENLPHAKISHIIRTSDGSNSRRFLPRISETAAIPSRRIYAGSVSRRARRPLRARSTAPSASALTRSGNHTCESHGTGIKKSTSGVVSDDGRGPSARDRRIHDVPDGKGPQEHGPESM